MKKVFLFLLIGFIATTAYAQEEKVADSLETETLDEVLVKAVRVNKKAPVTHSNLSKEEISKRNLGQDIPILMNYMPSVVTTSDAGAGVGYTGIRVRGSDATRVNVTINGIPYNDAESQGTFWVNMPDFSSSVESLQLQRGVGTSTNGSGAFGASLNILTDAVSKEAYGETSNSFGSFNTRKHNVKFSTGKLNERIELSGRLSKIESDGYIDRASSDLKAYYLQAAYVTDKTLLKAITFGGHEITYQSWFGIDAATLASDRTFNPAGMYTDEDGNTRFYDKEEDNYKQDHYQLHWNQKYNNYWSTNIGLNYTYGRGYFEQYKEDEDFATYGFEEIVVGGETINTTDLIRRRWLDNDYYVVNLNANYKKSNLDVIFGTSYSYYDGEHFGEVIWARYASDSEIRDPYYDNFGRKTDFSVFTKANYKVNDKLMVYGDLQLRTINYKASGVAAENVDDNFSFFNPKAGLTYSLNASNDLYFSYARANREPNRTDYENGNPEHETLNDFELGWRYESNKIQLNTNMYYMLYKNQLVLTGEIDNVGAPIRENSGDSYRLGLEVDATFRVSNKFYIKPNLALSTNKNKDFVTSRDGQLVNLGNTNISFSPSVVAGNILVFQPVDKLQMAFLSKFVGEQYMGNVDSEVSKLDSYFVNDFNVTYELKPKSIFKSIMLSALVNNVFGEKYVSNGYYYTYDDDFSNPGTIQTIEGTGYYPQATTNFLLGATLRF